MRKENIGKEKKQEKQDRMVFDKAKILDRCKKLETQEVEVAGWGGACVRMKNLTFQEIVQISIDAGNDIEAKNAMTVAAVCEDLDITDAYKLQIGNGAQFAMLYGAVNDFLGCRIKSEEIKN